MMVSYVQVFAMNLRERIYERVKIKSIFITQTYNDDLYIQITLNGGLQFKTRIYGISDKILNGYTTKYAAYEIIGELRKFIMDSYFK